MPILLPVALDQTYDYLLPEDLAGSAAAPPGAFVLVPFGPQTRIGVVWDAPFGDPGKPVPDVKLKTVAALLPEVPPLPILSLRFAEWVARYTLTPLGMVVRMMMGAPTVFEPARPRFGVVNVTVQSACTALSSARPLSESQPVGRSTAST